MSGRRSFCDRLASIGGLWSESASCEVSLVLIQPDQSVASDAFYALHFKAYGSVAEASSSSRFSSLSEEALGLAPIQP